MTTIHFDAVSHSYGDRRVLADINLTLTEHSIGIIGANGSGKSTLARMINGLVEPTSGTVTVDGVNVSRHGREVRKKVGFVFTDADTQIVMPTVAEDVAFSLRRSGLSKSEIADKVQATLRHMGLDEFPDHPAHLLSGGQKQMLALAAVLVRQPQIVIADEPTTLLDLRNARIISDMIQSLPQQVVVVTHQLDLLTSFDRIVVIDGGRVVYDAAPSHAIAFYRTLVDEGLRQS
ncbi:MAG: ABC transporter ATP-binding protein [Nakamurella sp.]